MADEMFFTNDQLSLHRGKRGRSRTDTCRPCLVKAKDGSFDDIEGVVMDISPFGMLVRLIESVPVGTELLVQLMRDESFQVPFSSSHEGTVVRIEANAGGFADHGIKLINRDVRRVESKPVAPRPRPTPRRTRMHTLDVTVGDKRRGR
jgi:hypothetical protein